MKQAIQKAIEGGWDIKKSFNVPDNAIPSVEFAVLAEKMWQTVVCDPSFWQCLGKSLGWSIERLDATGKAVYAVSEWYDFIDHIADGKDVESFFKELLK